jgi:pilus assembly protein Flp/PilA
MHAIKERFTKLFRDEEGATATEYAVMLVLIIVVCLGTIVFLGERVEEGFNAVGTALEDAINS